MKQRIIFLIIGILCLLPSHVLAKEIHVVGIGDSITTGYGVTKTDSYYEKIVTYLQQEKEVSSKNMAIDGLTTTQLKSALTKDEMRKSIQVADYILMSIGGNDLLQELSSNYTFYLTPKEEYPVFQTIQTTLLSNTKDILNTLVSLNPKATILMVPLYNPYQDILKQNTNLLSLFRQVKSDYVTLAKSYDQVMIDGTLSDTIEQKKYLNANGFQNLDPHPNQNGHQLIFEREKDLLTHTEIIPEKKKGSILPYVGILGLILLLFFFLKWRRNRLF